jgi:hypothetical protein
MGVFDQDPTKFLVSSRRPSALAWLDRYLGFSGGQEAMADTLATPLILLSLSFGSVVILHSTSERCESPLRELPLPASQVDTPSNTSEAPTLSDEKDAADGIPVEEDAFWFKTNLQKIAILAALTLLLGLRCFACGWDIARGPDHDPMRGRLGIVEDVLMTMFYVRICHISTCCR